ncbi:MAG: hypothetical protein GWP11_08230 [Proteobacteria bacterium]|nr:hypothetical protein [Pseudomonadota bacterium]
MPEFCLEDIDWDRGIANIAARSLAVRDLCSGLERLTRYARRAAVFLYRDHVQTWAFIRWTPK